MKKTTIKTDYSLLNLRFPVDLERLVEITDPVYTFNEVIGKIDLKKYYVDKESVMGRPRYDPDRLLKVILFAFMENGYSSLRNIEHLCKTDIRYIWLLAGEKAPTHMTVCSFLNKYVGEKIEDLFRDINQYMFNKDKVDLDTLYIDGTKIEANANKYTWVWKKSCLKLRDRVYSHLTELIKQMNDGVLKYDGVKIEIRQEYAIEYVEEVLEKFSKYAGVTEEELQEKAGRRKTTEQRQYTKMAEYLKKLKKYARCIEICGEERNSYSKTDKDATFMRVKRDHMANDQLLPAYNMQIGVCDEYIAVVDSKKYASDMDCFVPLLEKFKKLYNKYPQYPVADAGYGSFNNYLYCEKSGMQKYMKFPMFAKETKDKKYRENPYRVENFKRNDNGELLCPNGCRFVFYERKPIRGNKYGRMEEVYRCENCEGCPHRAECCKGSGNRTITLNKELTEIHKEVLDNLQSDLGVRLRTNRSIQAEGTFGAMKWNRSYKRAQRRGIDSVILEFTLIAIGYNLYKYHKRKLRAAKKKAEDERNAAEAAKKGTEEAATA